MKKTIATIVLATICAATFADTVYVPGYFKSNGTYVEGHYKTTPNEFRFDNRNSQSNGGSQRDEFSSPPEYNKPKKCPPGYIYC